MRAYYELGFDFREKNYGKWAIVDRGQLLGVFDTEAAASNRACEDDTTGGVFMQWIGHEREDTRSEILPIDYEASDPKIAVPILSELRGGSKGKICLRYHPKECTIMKASEFSNYSYFDATERRIFAWVLLQTPQMIPRDEGVPITALVDTGCTELRVHEDVYAAIGEEFPGLMHIYCNGQKVRMDETRKDHVRIEGINVIGLNTMLKIGLSIEREDGGTPSMRFHAQTPRLRKGEETNVRYHMSKP